MKQNEALADNKLEIVQDGDNDFYIMHNGRTYILKTKNDSEDLTRINQKHLIDRGVFEEHNFQELLFMETQDLFSTETEKTMYIVEINAKTKEEIGDAQSVSAQLGGNFSVISKSELLKGIQAVKKREGERPYVYNVTNKNEEAEAPQIPLFYRYQPFVPFGQTNNEDESLVNEKQETEREEEAKNYGFYLYVIDGTNLKQLKQKDISKSEKDSITLKEGRVVAGRDGYMLSTYPDLKEIDSSTLEEIKNSNILGKPQETKYGIVLTTILSNIINIDYQVRNELRNFAAKSDTIQVDEELEEEKRLEEKRKNSQNEENNFEENDEVDEHIPSTSKVPHAPSSHIYQLFTQTDNKDKSSVYKKQEEEERKRKEEEEKRLASIKNSFSGIKGILNDIKLSPEEKEESFNEEMNEFNELVIELFNENREKYKIKEEDNEEEKRKKYELQQEVATEYLFGCCNEFGDAHGIKCFLNLIDKMQGEENNSENKGKTSESKIDKEFMKSMAEKIKLMAVKHIIVRFSDVLFNNPIDEEARQAMLEFYNKYIKDENEEKVEKFEDISTETLKQAVNSIENKSSQSIYSKILEMASKRLKKKEWEKNGFFSDKNTSDKEKEMCLKTSIDGTKYYVLSKNGFRISSSVGSGYKIKVNSFKYYEPLYLVPVSEFQKDAGEENIKGENVIELEPTNGFVDYNSIKNGLEKKKKRKQAKEIAEEVAKLARQKEEKRKRKEEEERRQEEEERKKLEEEVKQKRLAEADERRQAEEERKKLEEEERRRAEEKRQKAAEEEERRKQERKEIAKEIKKEWEKNGFFSDENTSDKEKEMRLKTLIGESGTEYYILDKDGRPKTWPVKSGCKVKIDNFYYNNKCSSLYLVPVLEFKENAGKKNIEGENVIELEPTNGIVNFDSIEEGLEIKEEEQLISSILSTETLDRQQLDTEEYNDSDSVNSEESRERKSTYLMSDSDGEIFSIDGRDDKRDDDDIPPVSSSLYQNKPTIPLSTQPVPSVPDNQEDKLSFVPYDGKGLLPKNKNFYITYGGKSYALKIGTSPEKSTLMDQTYIDSDRIQDQKDFSDNDVLFLKGNKIKGKTIFITEIDPNTKKENIYKKPQAIIINGGEVSTDILKRGIQDIKEKEVSVEVMPFSIEYGRQKLEEQIKREKAGRIAREAKRRQEEEKRLKSSSPSSLLAFSNVNKGGEADNSSIASFIKSEQKKNKGR